MGSDSGSSDSSINGQQRQHRAGTTGDPHASMRLRTWAHQHFSAAAAQHRRYAAVLLALLARVSHANRALLQCSLHSFLLHGWISAVQQYSCSSPVGQQYKVTRTRWCGGQEAGHGQGTKPMEACHITAGN